MKLSPRRGPKDSSPPLLNMKGILPNFAIEILLNQDSQMILLRRKTEFYDILDNLRLLPFLCHRQSYYPELVRVFYSNLQITDERVIVSEVKKILIRMDINMFYHFTKLGTHNVCFEGNMVEEWRDDYSSPNAKSMICHDNVNIGGRILAGYMKVETRILHYIICHCLLPKQVTLPKLQKKTL